MKHALGQTKVSIIALSRYVTPEDVTRAKNIVSSLGWIPKIPKSILSRELSYAGPPSHRSQMLHNAYADMETELILCMRGGNGVNHILPLLDLNLVSKFHKPLVGYSDYTTLLNYLHRKLKLPMYHGPMLSKEYPKMSPSLENLKLMLSGAECTHRIATEQVLVHGVAKGVLIGGNVALFVRSLGTPYSIDTKGAILFFEAVDKSPEWLLDSFIQLEQANMFAECKGILLGSFKNCPEYKKFLFPFFRRLNVPTIAFQLFGHDLPNMTLPIGRQAILDTNALFWKIEKGEPYLV